MDSNTHSTGPPQGPQPPEPLEHPEPLALSDDLAGLAVVIDQLATHDIDRLPDPVRAQRIQGLRQLADRLEGQWFKELAAFDARGVAATDVRHPTPSTAGWLRTRLRMGAGAAHEAVRTARALFRGPLPGTAEALVGGVISPAHARVLAQGTRQVPHQVAAQAEPVLLEAARRLDPPVLRQAVGYLLEVADPDGAEAARERRHARRGLWLSPTWDGMVAVAGLLEAEAGQIVRAALEPLARPSEADDTREGGQRTADALCELARRSLEEGRLPRAGGVRPHLLVTVDLNSLLGRPGGPGGDLGWAGPLDPHGCRRLACDAAVTRVVVSRHHLHDQHPEGGSAGPDEAITQDPGADPGLATDADPSDPAGLQQQLWAAASLLPPTLGGAPTQPLEVGRATRVIQPAQRAALAVRDRGCVFPGCDRPLAWCDAHHLWHWIDGGPTDLGNLAMVCRAHHRAVHEGGWRLIRGPDGRFTASPGHRRHRPAA
jgi:hypothetical protein